MLLSYSLWPQNLICHGHILGLKTNCLFGITHTNLNLTKKLTYNNKHQPKKSALDALWKTKGKHILFYFFSFTIHQSQIKAFTNSDFGQTWNPLILEVEENNNKQRKITHSICCYKVRAALHHTLPDIMFFASFNIVTWVDRSSYQTTMKPWTGYTNSQALPWSELTARFLSSTVPAPHIKYSTGATSDGNKFWGSTRNPVRTLYTRTKTLIAAPDCCISGV